MLFYVVEFVMLLKLFFIMYHVEIKFSLF